MASIASNIKIISKAGLSKAAVEIAVEIAGAPRVGNLVRVKSTITEPTYKWGSVKPHSVGVVTEIKGQDIFVEFPEQKRWKGRVSEMEVLPRSSSINFGDRVRVKASIDSPTFGWGSVKYEDIGVVSKVDKCVQVNFPEANIFKGVLSEFELADGKAGVPRANDRVRVKPSIATPCFGWGAASKASVGTLSSVSQDDFLVCSFPSSSSWKCFAADVEVVPLVAGDIVRVKPAVTPRFGFGSVTHSSVGTIAWAENHIQVELDGDKARYQGLLSEFEKADGSTGPLRVGAEVRLKASVTAPTYGLAGRNREALRGHIKAIFPDTMVSVNFPEQPGWKCLGNELERLPVTAFNAGDRVKVKAGTTPKFGWGSLPEGSTEVGVVKSCGDGIVAIDFPSHQGWKCLLAEVEKA